MFIKSPNMRRVKSKGNFVMENKNLTKYFISCGAILYTVFSMLFMLISSMMTENSGTVILRAELYVYILLYMYVIALGNTLMRIEKISSPIRRLLHAICYNIGCLAFLLMCGMKFSAACICVAIFAVIYTVAVTVSSLIKKKKNSQSSSAVSKVSGTKNPKKNNDKSDTYKSMFS